MKIYVLGSTSFKETMVETAEKLRELGHDGWIHDDYIKMVSGDMEDHVERWKNGERAALKKEKDYLKSHYKHILESDATLFVNLEKNGIQNYIGGNVLIEMGQAHVHDKKIFFLNGMPEGLPYMDEIEAMEPICLHGALENIKKHI